MLTVVTVLSSKSRQPEEERRVKASSQATEGAGLETERWQILTHVAALAVLVVGQAGVRCVVPPNHASVVVDHSIQVVHGQLLLALPANAELAQVQVPGERHGDSQGLTSISMAAQVVSTQEPCPPPQVLTGQGSPPCH